MQKERMPGKMGADPLISIIIPLFNCLALTQACLDSLLRTLPATASWEIILVDDGSTDGTKEWLSRLDRAGIRIHLNDTNVGYACSNNRAARLARGSILALLNNDLVLQPGWLEPLLEGLDRNKDAGIIGNIQYSARTGALDHAGIMINAKGKPEHVRELPPFSPKFARVPAVTGACLVIRRETWNAVGGFDEGYVNGGEDVDLCFKVAAMGKQVLVSTQSRVLHHVSPSANRKRRDEENAYRLTLRWRRQLLRWGLHAWAVQRLDRDLDGAVFGDALDTFHLALFRLGLTPRPPASAVRGMDAALEIEEKRWVRLLGSNAT